MEETMTLRFVFSWESSSLAYLALDFHRELSFLRIPCFKWVIFKHDEKCNVYSYSEADWVPESVCQIFFGPTCLSGGFALSALEDRDGCRLLSSELQRDSLGERRWQRSLDRPRSLSPCCQCSDRETKERTFRRGYMAKVATLICRIQVVGSVVSLTNKRILNRHIFLSYCQQQREMVKLHSAN